MLSEILDRLPTSASIVGSAQAQLAKERQNSIIASSSFSLAGFVHFNVAYNAYNLTIAMLTIAFAYNQFHFNYGHYNKI